MRGTRLEKRNASFWTESAVGKMLSILCVLSLFLVSSCEYGIGEGFYRPHDVSERASSLTVVSDSDTEILSSSVGGRKYRVLAVSDIHFGKNGNADSNARKVLEWVRMQGDIDMCINVGDTADHGRAEELDSFISFENELKSLGVKNVYSCLGNHDLYNSGWESWKEKVYPNASFYTFTIGSISYYFIDSASGSLGKAQMKMLDDAMKADENKKIVVSHYPIHSEVLMGFCGLQETKESDLLLDMFYSNGVIQVIEGHSHVYGENDFKRFKEVNVPSLCKEGHWVLFTVDEENMKVSHRLIKR